MSASGVVACLWPPRPLYMHMHTVATIARNRGERKGAPFACRQSARCRARFALPPIPLANRRDTRCRRVTWSGRSGASTLPAGTPSRLGTRPSTFFCLSAARERDAVQATKDASPPPVRPSPRRLAVGQPAIASADSPSVRCYRSGRIACRDLSQFRISTLWGNHRMKNKHIESRRLRLAGVIAGWLTLCAATGAGRGHQGRDHRIQHQAHRRRGRAARADHQPRRDQSQRRAERDGDHEPHLREQQRRQCLAVQRDRLADVQQPDRVAAWAGRAGHAGAGERQARGNASAARSTGPTASNLALDPVRGDRPRRGPEGRRLGDLRQRCDRRRHQLHHAPGLHRRRGDGVGPERLREPVEATSTTSRRPRGMAIWRRTSTTCSSPPPTTTRRI